MFKYFDTYGCFGSHDPSTGRKVNPKVKAFAQFLEASNF